jgi:hypothetical protein
MSAVYALSVIAMQSEVQNILHTIKYEELEKAENSVREITKKYYALAADATRTITGALSNAKAGKGQTIDDFLRKNITELEYLFLTSVRIEYTYYVKKEQAKAEQAALREQMRLEAAEKKALEAERQKIEKEETKYQTEINKLSAAISDSQSDDEKTKMAMRIDELQTHLAAIAEKKEEIVSRQNGKAGTVYIISNLGSFGDDVFKVGMTRRLEPQERVDELGDASVPFRFDVHSFIFSEDAVALETKLHAILAEKRVNKVNSRKEFFRIKFFTVYFLQKLSCQFNASACYLRIIHLSHSLKSPTVARFRPGSFKIRLGIKKRAVHIKNHIFYHYFDQSGFRSPRAM